ncbi:biotin/lipoyl-containing protein [Candidimonas nitroreducens]|uniref:Lipoyl-binding domain-containing protein n=1 Tax=Candidimonas nitroreducens TaxID=683354 RepID=A0A225MRK7_9BURK|nr:biotin/lipoyl-containing protein [Candidimonas nitroreducens]OWT62101.1 hypothetical protein CEY11_09885 [Candidimonas nitroreducens]
MAKQVRITLPKLSEDFETGTFVAWHKKVGDRVEQGEIVAEIMTDKVNLEIESSASGTVQALLVQEEDSVRVGQELAILEC